MSARLRSSIVASVLAAWPAAPLMSQGGETFIYFEPAAVCNSATLNEEAQKVRIDTEGLAPGMISPDAAKRIALCWVPGQISSGEIESNSKRTVYEIKLLPTNKKTYSKVIVDAYTGQVLSIKQFGGARGYAGFVRESAERKKNKKP